jgi:membrane protease YdiL (CAAX protease family)
MQPATPGTSDARRVVAGASAALAALLVSAALLLRWLTNRNHEGLFHNEHIVVRIGIGAVIGAALASANATLVARLSAFARVRRLAHHAVEGIEPRWHTIVVVALAAGIGEEVFFRGALDPLAGRWLTAAAFVALHGALRIRDRNGLAFAAFLYAASVGLSALKAWNGLEAAIAAHTCYDLVMLLWLVNGASRRRGSAFD